MKVEEIDLSSIYHKFSFRIVMKAVFSFKNLAGYALDLYLILTLLSPQITPGNSFSYLKYFKPFREDSVEIDAIKMFSKSIF